MYLLLSLQHYCSLQNPPFYANFTVIYNFSIALIIVTTSLIATEVFVSPAFTSTSESLNSSNDVKDFGIVNSKNGFAIVDLKNKVNKIQISEDIFNVKE